MWNYVKNPYHGPQPLMIRKRYQDTRLKLTANSSKHVVWWQIAVERLFCCDDIRNKVMDPSELKQAFATLKKHGPPDASDLLQVTYLQKQYFLLRQGAFEDVENKLLQYLLVHPSYVQSLWTPRQFQRIWTAIKNFDAADAKSGSVRVQVWYRDQKLSLIHI